MEAETFWLGPGQTKRALCPVQVKSHVQGKLCSRGGVGWGGGQRCLCHGGPVVARLPAHSLLAYCRQDETMDRLPRIDDYIEVHMGKKGFHLLP